MNEPGRARAVLSTQDFTLIREAVLFYMQTHEGQPKIDRYSHLYHRLGSVADCAAAHCPPDQYPPAQGLPAVRLTQD